MLFSDLCKKDVVNVGDGRCLGNVDDLKLNERNGCPEELIVPGPPKWFGCMGREIEYHIPWCRIVRIGPDIILVDVKEHEITEKIKSFRFCGLFFD
jgi:YlmC/YmxH family sporulation protein